MEKRQENVWRKKITFLALALIFVMLFAFLVYALTSVVYNDQADFDSGTYNFTNYSSGYLGLISPTVDEAYLLGNQSELGFVNMSGNVILSYFNESSGDVQDYSGNSITGTAYDLGYGSSGQLGDGFTFDGANDAIDYGDIEMSSWTDMTISIWMKTTENSNSRRMVSKDRQGTTCNFIFWFDNNAQVGLWIVDSGTWRKATVARSQVNDGEWHHLVGTVDNDANAVYFYIDGELVADAPFNAATFSDGQNEEVVVGSDSIVGTFNQEWIGDLDEFALWNRSLSSTEVQTLYDLQSLSLGSGGQGNYTSNVTDAGSSIDWQYMTAYQEVCYECPLPDNSSSENGLYFNQTINMNDTIFLYHFDETSMDSHALGTDFYDSSGNYYHAEENGSVSLVDGVFGGAIRLDGTNDNSVTVGDFDFSTISNLTGSLWFRTNSSAKMRAISKDQEGQTGNFIFRMGNGAGKADIYLNDGGSYDFITSTTTVNDGLWHHLAFVVNAAEDYVALYLDGTHQGNATFSSDYLDDDPSLTIQIGSDSDPSTTRTQVVDGDLDEVMLAARAFTEEEIVAMYNRGKYSLSYDIRSCNDAACSGETYSSFSGNLPIDISSLTDNQYIQFQTNLDNELTGDNLYVYNVTLTDQSVDSGISSGVSWQCPSGCRDASESPGAETPAVILIDSPVNGTSGTDRAFEFIWNNSDIENATYDIQVSTAYDFSSTVISATALSEENASQTNYTSSDLAVDDVYYWRVRAVNGITPGDWSEVREVEVLSYLAISLPSVSGVDFGNLIPGQSEDTENTAGLQPIIIRNDGNYPVNITVNATNFFVNSGGAYQFKIEDNETGSYDSAFVSYTDLNSSAQQAVTNLNHENGSNFGNTVNMHLTITVPSLEPAADKTSLIEISTG